MTAPVISLINSVVVCVNCDKSYNDCWCWYELQCKVCSACRSFLKTPEDMEELDLDGDEQRPIMALAYCPDCYKKVGNLIAMT